MPAVVPALIAISAGAAVAGAVQSNQATQHAKGAAQAQQTAMDAQVKKAGDLDAAEKKSKNDNASATATAAMSALRASMSTENLLGGTILTGGSGAAPAPTAGKTLLGA